MWIEDGLPPLAGRCLMPEGQKPKAIWLPSSLEYYQSGTAEEPPRVPGSAPNKESGVERVESNVERDEVFNYFDRRAAPIHHSLRSTLDSIFITFPATGIGD